jgi:hypothetical protein
VLVSPARGENAEKKLAAQVAALEEKLARKDAVIAEISEEVVRHDNAVRLQSAIGYIAPNDFLAGRSKANGAHRDRKLANAHERRRLRRELARQELLV